MTRSTKSIVAARQEPLRNRYLEAAGDALIQDGARAVLNGASDPFHTSVVPHNHQGEPWAIGIHRAVGGDHDLPNPGDLLCAALATCLHTTTRLLADRLRIPVRDLDVKVTAEVDVRGCLLVSADVPVGFQRMRCALTMALDREVDEGRLRALMQMAERCCVVFQTLNGAVTIDTDWHLEHPGATTAAAPA